MRMFLFAFGLCASSLPADPLPVNPNIGHDHHHHRHWDKHETVKPPPERFHTARKSKVSLPLPNKKDAFTFVVYGNRTGRVTIETIE